VRKVALLDKLKFWKKESDFPELEGLGDLGMGGRDLALPNTEEIGAGFGEPSNDMPFESPQMSAQLGAPAQPQRYPSPAQMAAQQTSPVMPQAVPGYQITNRDVELILSKLDLIKSSLDNLSQRVAALEKIAKGETNW